MEGNVSRMRHLLRGDPQELGFGIIRSVGPLELCVDNYSWSVLRNP